MPWPRCSDYIGHEFVPVVSVEIFVASSVALYQPPASCRVYDLVHDLGNLGIRQVGTIQIANRLTVSIG